MSVSPHGRKQFIDQQIGHMPSKMKLYSNIGLVCSFDTRTHSVPNHAAVPQRRSLVVSRYKLGVLDVVIDGFAPNDP